MISQNEPDNDSDTEKLVYIVKEKINDKKISKIKKVKKLNVDAPLIEPILDEPKKDNKIIIKDDNVISSVPEVELKKDVIIDESKPIIDNQPVAEAPPAVSLELTKSIEAPVEKKKRVLTEKQKEHLKKMQALSKKSRDKKKKETIEDSTINKLKDVINTEVVNVIKPVIEASVEKVNKYNKEVSHDLPSPKQIIEPPKVVYVEPPKPISRYEQNMNMIYQKFKKVEPVKKVSFIELMRAKQK